MCISKHALCMNFRGRETNRDNGNKREFGTKDGTKRERRRTKEGIKAERNVHQFQKDSKSSLTC